MQLLQNPHWSIRKSQMALALYISTLNSSIYMSLVPWGWWSRKWSSVRKELSMATLQVVTTNGTFTPVQSVEYVPTNTYQHWWVRKRKALSIVSKVAVLLARKQNTKQPWETSSQTQSCPPSQSKGRQVTSIVPILTSPKFHLVTLLVNSFKR